MKFLLAVLIFVSCNILAFSQLIPGAKQNSMANSGVALSDDVFALYENPAGLAQINWKEAGLFYSPAPFGLSELSNAFAAYNQPFGFGNLSAGMMTYGFKLYRENKISIAYSLKYNKRFFAGITLNYHTISIKNYGNTSSFSFDLGGLAYISNKLRWGFDIKNINRGSYSGYKDQIPTVLSTGFSFDILEDASISAAIEKDVLYNPSFSFGIEYYIIDNIVVRTGFSNEPSKFSAGIGINYSIFSFDYAIYTHQVLGLTHQFGLIINFSGNTNRRKSIERNIILN